MLPYLIPKAKFMGTQIWLSSWCKRNFFRKTSFEMMTSSLWRQVHFFKNAVIFQWRHRQLKFEQKLFFDHELQNAWVKNVL